jgi:hypothetical protein
MKKLLTLSFLIVLALACSGQSTPPNASAAALSSDPQRTPETVTVYITNTGEKYHRSGCRHLAKSKIPIELTDAQRRGYTACKVCRPAR